MRTVVAFALGAIVGAPLLAAAKDSWIPVKLTWSRPEIPASGTPKATVMAELPSNGNVVFETNGLTDSYYLVSDGTDRACSVTVPRDTTFQMHALSDRGVSYMLKRTSGEPATVKYSGATAVPDAPQSPDPNPYNVKANVAEPSAQAARAARERKISPRPLESMGALRCTSDTVALAGVWRTPEGYLEDVGKDRQSNLTTWHIVIAGERAVVSRVDGVSGAAVESEIWNVGRSALGGMEGGVGLLLTPKNRVAEVSPEAITIDEKTSSFVYTTQHVNSFYNRANVFYGTCSAR